MWRASEDLSGLRSRSSQQLPNDDDADRGGCACGVFDVRQTQRYTRDEARVWIGGLDALASTQVEARALRIERVDASCDRLQVGAQQRAFLLEVRDLWRLGIKIVGGEARSTGHRAPGLAVSPHTSCRHDSNLAASGERSCRADTHGQRFPRLGRVTVQDARARAAKHLGTAKSVGSSVLSR